MSTTRIRLTRIIAFNWYGFRTIIEVNGLTLLCGETGTGKSALLDLIQFVMSAGSVKFNKAAAGESNSRDLRGYCLCDTNTRQGDGQPRFLRRSGATVAALEFSWHSIADEEPRRETWGIRVQYESPSAQPSYVRFFVPGRMERADLCDETGSLLSEELFRLRVKRELGGDPGFTSHKAFQEEMGVARHLHFDDQQMRKTLPKAIAFELDSDYQRFIREFILEPSPPDVTSTRRSLDALRQAAARVNQLHDQQKRLELIAEQDSLYQNAFREQALFGHLRYALDDAETEEKLTKAKNSLQMLRDRHAENQRCMQQAVADKESAQQNLDAVKLIAGKEDQGLSEFERLSREESRLAEEVARLTAKSQTAHKFLTERAQAWDHWLAEATTANWKVEIDTAKLAVLRSVETHIALDSVARLAREFDRVSNETKERLKPTLAEIEELEGRKAKLTRELTQLKAGRTAPSPLFDFLRSTGTRAYTLGRVVEVSAAGEPWWGVIETLLGDVRNAVLVDSKLEFLRAREAWMSMPKGEPLIDPEAIPAQTPGVGTLAAFLETTNPIARQFLNWRFGHVVAMPQGADLDSYSFAVTPEGTVKEAPLLRHIVPEKEFTLGEEGLRRLRTAKEGEHASVAAQLTTLEHQKESVFRWLQRGKDARLDQDDVPDGSSETRRLPELRKDLQQTRKALKLIETPELRDRLEQLRQLESALAAANQKIGKLEGPLTEFQINQSKLEEDLETTQRERQDTGIKLHESRVALPAGIRDGDIAQCLQAAMGTATSWKQRREQAESAHDSWQRQAGDAKNQRLQLRGALLAAHIDEFGEFDPQDESNARFDQRLAQIREHEVQRFENIASERRAEWEKRLQEDVLNELSERLKNARQTVEDFRRILGREIGGYRYVLSQTRDSLHRAMWKLIDQSDDGLEAGDPLQDWKLQAEIEEAKCELMQAVDQPEDKRAAALLDYRNYHRYDLKMVPATHTDDSEGSISLQQSGRNLSGGEGQAPFFVAMLAAFHRVYDRGQRGQQSNLGLVVMDEAFSKLSAGHIADCLALAEGFGLQQ